MSDIAKADKVTSLLDQAKSAVRQGQTQIAFQHLQKAAHLDRGNQSVSDALRQLTLHGSESHLLDYLETYAESQYDSDYKRLQQDLGDKKLLSSNDAERAYDIIVVQDFTREPWNEILSLLVLNQYEFRRVIARRHSSEPATCLRLLLVTTQSVSQSLINIVFEKDAWSAEDVQTKAQQVLFKETVTSLKTADVDLDRLAWIILRLCTAVSSAVVGNVDMTTLSSIFELYQPRRSARLQTTADLIVSQLHKASPEKIEALFTTLVTKYVSSGQVGDLILVLCAVARLFPVLSTTCASMLLTDGFLQQLVPILELPRVTDEDDSQATALRSAALQLLNAACIDKACREAIQQKCGPTLIHLTQDDQHGLPAGLVVTKLHGGDTDAEVMTRFIRAVKAESDVATAIEGLVYTTLKPANKEKVIADAELLKALLLNLREKNKFGCLTIMVNLTAYRPARSEEQKKMSQLKAYANSSKPIPDDPLDNNGVVAARCKKLLEAGIVSTLMASSTSGAENPLQAEILCSLARESKHRSKMVQEGAVKRLLQLSSTQQTSVETRTLAAHALSRVLISVNPEHVFSAALPATSAVGAILPLLDLDQQKDQRDLLPVFETLLALTNLASMGDSNVCDLIIRKAWPVLEDQYLLSSNTLLQRASAELICNLMLSPSGIALFADGSDQAARRLHILLALADVNDIATRKAAGGALAMLTEWDNAVVAILNKIPRGMKILLTMCEDDSDDVRYRGIVCLLNCINIPETKTDVKKKLLAENAGAIVDKMKSFTKVPEVADAAADLLSQLT